MADVTQLVTPTDDPAIFDIAGLGQAKIETFYAGRHYDSVYLASGAISTANINFFVGVNGRTRQWSSFITDGQLPPTQAMTINKVSATLPQAVGNVLLDDSDALKIGSGHMHVAINSKRVIYDQPLYSAQSGDGFTGQTTRQNAGVLTIGVANHAGAPELLVAQSLRGRADSITGYLSFVAPPVAFITAAQWTAPVLTNGCVVTANLDGVIVEGINP